MKYAQPRDSGIYECQVNTEPKISMAFRLNVIGEYSCKLATCWREILHLNYLPPVLGLRIVSDLSHARLAARILQLAMRGGGGKLTTFCSPRESLINWAESLATHTMRTVVNTLKFLQVCVSVGYLHMLY